MNNVFINDKRTLDWLIGGTRITFKEMNHKVKNGRFRDDVIVSSRHPGDNTLGFRKLILRSVCCHFGLETEATVRPLSLVKSVCDRSGVLHISTNKFLLSLVSDFAEHLKGITRPGELSNLNVDGITFTGVLKEGVIIITMRYSGIKNPTVAESLESKGLRAVVDARYQSQRFS